MDIRNIANMCSLNKASYWSFVKSLLLIGGSLAKIVSSPSSPSKIFKLTDRQIM